MILGRKAVITVPYWPGSNGDADAIRAIKDYGMQPLPLYFHFGDERQLEENAQMLLASDGAFIPGGFPYEDRLGFGRVPASIKQFAGAMKRMAADGKPILAICAGDQIASVMRLAFLGTPYSSRMLPNIYDRNGAVMHEGFLDRVVHTKLACDPGRTAFTRSYNDGEVMPQIIDHGGGRFWADAETLRYLLANGMVVRRYCDKNGNTEDNFPANPNGSMLNIESITNRRGNLKLGMCHDERKTNALCEDRANLSLASMREYIEDGMPDLSGVARPQDIELELKDYSYMSPDLDPARTYDILIRMLTDDNERTTAQLFLGSDGIDRRRLIRIELAEGCGMEDAKAALIEIARMDFYSGIVLKKDVPCLTRTGEGAYSYEVTDRRDGKITRNFIRRGKIIDGFPVTCEDVASPNPEAYALKARLRRNPKLGNVTGVQTGSVFFFPDEGMKQRALSELFY